MPGLLREMVCSLYDHATECSNMKVTRRRTLFARVQAQLGTRDGGRRFGISKFRQKSAFSGGELCKTFFQLRWS